MEQFIIFSYVGGGALLLGLAFGAAFGSSALRMLGLIVLGALVLVAILAALILVSPTEEQTSDECWECAETFGHWVQAVIFFLALWNLIAWAFGLCVGAGVRALAARRRSPAA